ncbi:hypothetical protein BpHYR1_053650 [Brachionus plicatilis]|uniref:Uncharacterized protein n=1 Tax=Brachionus plicatilis TaxID=10195 RepID=A0A3M7RSK8_BRAPC|nr:hypothetical protein BpHYR1_053650 [Brachionus plicatilis]
MAEKIKSMEREKIDYNELAVDDDLPTLSYPEDGDNGEEMEETEQHPLDSYIESFDPTVETIIQNTIVQSPPPQTELPFLIPTLPQIVQNSLTESSHSKPQPKTLSSPIPHSGSAQLETQISSSYESHYESNNESNDKTQTKFKKERMKRNTSVLANTKKKEFKKYKFNRR